MRLSLWSCCRHPNDGLAPCFHMKCLQGTKHLLFRDGNTEKRDCFQCCRSRHKALQIWVCAWPRFRTTWPTWHLGTHSWWPVFARQDKTKNAGTCNLHSGFLGHKSILTSNYQFTDTCKCYVSSVKLVQNILPSTSGWCIIHMNLHLTSFQFGSQELPINCTNSSCFKENPLRCTRNIENPTPLFASAPLATLMSNSFWIPVILFLFYFSVIHLSMTRTPPTQKRKCMQKWKWNDVTFWKKKHEQNRHIQTSHATHGWLILSPFNPFIRA